MFSHNKDYYLLFSEIGWSNIIKGKITITDYENFPIVVINKYSNYFKTHCKSIIKTSVNHKTIQLAKNLLEILRVNPQKLPDIMDDITLEYCRQVYLEKHEKPIVKFIINYLVKLVKSNHSIITYKDILSCQPLLNELQELFTLINDNSSKNTDKLKINTNFFVNIIYPKKKANSLQLAYLIKSLDSLSTNKLNRFFYQADKKCNKERVPKMISELYCVMSSDPNKLPLALKSIARISQLPTYQWSKQPVIRYSDAPIMKQIREMPLLNSNVFFGQQVGSWKSIDLFPDFLDDIAPRCRPTREMALAINEKYLYEMRQIGGEEFFLEYRNGNKLHCMHFNAENTAKRITDSLNGLYKIGEWKKKDCEQRVRIYKMPDIPQKMINILISMGILITVSSDKLFAEIMATLEMSLNEQIDLIIKLLKNEFENEKNGYFILNPALVSNAYQIKGIPLESTSYEVGINKKCLNATKAITAVICGGASVWFGIYKGLISRLLMNGINVLAFSYRGYELSEGIPTEQKISQDLETVCQYLKEDKMISNKQILLYASCMGLMPSSRYVENHPKTNLFIDRSFASISTLITFLIQEQNVFQLPNGIKKITAQTANRVIPYLANFENLSHLQNTKGEIALVTAEKDEILENEAQLLKKGLPKAYHISSPGFFGHAGNWLKDPAMIAQFESYLSDKKFSRNMCI